MREIKEIDKRVWILTTDGLYRVDADQVLKLGSWNEETVLLEEADGVWVRTNTELFRADTKTVSRITGLRGIIKVVRAAAGRVWVGTSDGLFRVEGNQAKQFGGIPGLVGTVREFAGQAWVACSIGGLYRIIGDGAVPVPGVKRYVDPNPGKDFGTSFVADPVLEEIAGQILFGGYYENTYVVEHNQARPLSGLHGFAQSIQEVNKQTWITTDVGIFAVGAQGGEAAQPVFDFRANSARAATAVKETPDAIWIATYDGPYRIDKQGYKIHPVRELREMVLTIEEIDGLIWIGTDKGVYRITSGVERVLGVPWGRQFKEMAGKIWIAGPTLYRVERNATGAEPIRGVLAPQFSLAAGKLWMVAPSTPFRLDENVSIKVNLKSSEGGWKSALSWLSSANWFVEGTVRAEPRYESSTDHAEPYGDSFAKEFFVILTPDRDSFDEALKRDAFSPAKYFERSLPWGKNNVYVSVRDLSGNTFLCPRKWSG